VLCVASVPLSMNKERKERKERRERERGRERESALFFPYQIGLPSLVAFFFVARLLCNAEVTQESLKEAPRQNGRANFGREAQKKKTHLKNTGGMILLKM